MTPEVKDIDILVKDRTLGKIVKRNLRTSEFRNARPHLHFRDPSDKLGASARRPLYVLSWVADAEKIEWKRLESLRKGLTYCLFFQELLPTSAGVERLEALGILRTIRNWHVHGVHPNGDEADLVRRLLKTLLRHDTSKRILDAHLQGRELLIVSINLEKLLVPLGKFSCFAQASVEMLADFEIDEDGSFVFWPALDVHLGWEQFLQVLDPAKALKARQKSEGFNRRYGAAIRSFRISHGLRQQDIVGLDSRQVRRIEQGKCRATSAALGKLSKAHGMDLDVYLKEIAIRTG